MTVSKQPAVPNLPVWRLHMMRDEAERRVKRTGEEHERARRYKQAVDDAIARANRGMTVLAWKDINIPDVRGWVKPEPKAPSGS